MSGDTDIVMTEPEPEASTLPASTLEAATAEHASAGKRESFNYVAKIGEFPNWKTVVQSANECILAVPSRKWYEQLLALDYATIFKEGWPDSTHTNFRQHMMRYVNPDIPPPFRGQETFGHSWMAQYGGCGRIKWSLGELKIMAEAGDDYASAKVFCYKNTPAAMMAELNDSLRHHWFHSEPIPSARKDDFGLGPGVRSGDLRAGILSRTLVGVLTQHILWREIRDTVYRLEALGMGKMEWPIEGQFVRNPQIKKEYDFLWMLSWMLRDEIRNALRCAYAGGPGKDIVRRYLDKPGSGDPEKDLRFRVKGSWDELERKSPFDVALAGICLGGIDNPRHYGGTDLLHILAFEQLAQKESNLVGKYNTYIQLLHSELCLAIDLTNAIQLAHPNDTKIDDIPRSAYRAEGWSTTMQPRFKVVSESIMSILQAFDPNMFSARFNEEEDMDCCQIIWQTLEIMMNSRCQAINVQPEELFDFLNPDQAKQIPPARWVLPKESADEPDRLATPLEHPIFKVSKEQMKLVKIMFNPVSEEVCKWDELFDLFKTIGFRVDWIGAMAILLVPPEKAGTPIILRKPHPGSGIEKLYPDMLSNFGEEYKGAYGWDASWFEIKRAKKEGDDGWEDI